MSPRLLFFLITYPGIEVTSRLFWSNSVGLRVDFKISTAAVDYSYFPIDFAVKTLLFGRIFAKFEDLDVVHVGDQIQRFCAELVDLLRMSQILNWANLYSCGSQLLDQPLDFGLACCVLLLDCRKELQNCCDPRYCYRFLRNFSNRSMVPKMILLLGFVDLADHIASSFVARLVALSELSAPSGRAHPEFSFIPVSQNKLQAMCCRERLHVTVSGKIADLSLGRASNCTNILYIEGVSKYSCMAPSLVS